MSMTDLERDLESFPLFAGTDGADRALIARMTFVQSFPADVRLFGQGTAVDFLHGIVDGHVELSGHHHARRYTVMMAGAGDLTPLAAIAGLDVASVTACTVTRSRVLMIPVPVLRSLAERDHRFMDEVFRETVLAGEALLRESHARNLQRSSERLASWIHRHLADDRDDQEIVIAYNKRLFASVLGVSPATLARDIEVLAAYGVVFKGRRVRVRKVSELVAAANLLPEPGPAEYLPARPPGSATRVYAATGAGLRPGS